MREKISILAPMEWVLNPVSSGVDDFVESMGIDGENEHFVRLLVRRDGR